MSGFESNEQNESLLLLHSRNESIQTAKTKWLMHSTVSSPGVGLHNLDVAYLRV